MFRWSEIGIDLFSLRNFYGEKVILRIESDIICGFGVIGFLRNVWFIFIMIY